MCPKTLERDSLWKKYKTNFRQHRGSIALWLVFSVLWTGFGLEFKNGTEVITNLSYVLAGVIMISFTICRPLLYLLKPKQVAFPGLGMISTAFVAFGIITVFINLSLYLSIILVSVGVILSYVLESKKDPEKIAPQTKQL